MKKICFNNYEFIFLCEKRDANIVNNKNEIKKLLISEKKVFIYYLSELNKHKKIIKEKINYHKGIYVKIHARKCKIKEINNIDKNNFLNNNHIQGSDLSQIMYGAYYNNELVAVTTFDNKRNFKGGEKTGLYELNRFCIKSGFKINGIFSKILKQFIIKYKPNKLISFANKRWSSHDNNIYLNNKFKLMKTISQDYYYYKNNLLLHKFNFGKNKIKLKYPNIFNPNKTESELTTELGYIKIWDLGKLKYELHIKENGNIICGYIYMIKNKINNKIYIGQTVRSLEKRIHEYKKALLYNNFYNKHLLSSFKKYGFDNFEFSIIDTAETIDELNEKEINYIKLYNSTNKNIGYNQHSGGRNAIPNEETLNKMSIAHKGKKQSKEWVEKRIPKAGSEEAKKHGRPKTEEQKKYLSEISPKFWQGKHRSDDTKRKIAETKANNGCLEKYKKLYSKKVYLKNIETNEIQDFDSTRIAGEKLKLHQSTVSERCKYNMTVKGILYTYNDPK
jgi:group I intron endonuclease